MMFVHCVEEKVQQKATACTTWKDPSEGVQETLYEVVFT